MCIRSFLFILILLAVFGECIGQQPKNVITQQIWLDFNSEYTINSKFTLLLRADARTVFPQSWYRFITGAGVSYKHRPYSDQKIEEEFHAGIGFFYSLNLDFPDRLEIRPYQGYRLRWPNFSRLAMQHYLRLEERFEFTEGRRSEEFGLRLRYLAQATIQCRHCDNSFMKPFYLPLSAEFFFNLNGVNQFNDVIRIGPGLGYRFSSGLRQEFNFTFNRTKGSVDERFSTSDFIFRFRVFYKIPEKKKIVTNYN